jgi:3-oxoadipate enol-lactonase
VLLVMGLGMNATGWWRSVPVLAERFRVLAFDNRGMGRSSLPASGYAMADLADDAVAVLDAAGEDAAHVYGISLGGMIAQHIALRHPERVRSLVLAATTPGGKRLTPADGDTLAFFQRRGAMPPEEAVWASVPYNYAPRTRAHHAHRIGEDIVQRLRFPFAPQPYLAQLEAALGHDPGDGLATLAVPALVVHGELDRMIPVANAHALAHVIPDAELRLYPEAGHLLFTDEPQVDRDVLAWLAS